MRDDDKLRFPAEAAQVAREAFDIPVVQRGVDLVEHAERRRPHLQNGKIQRDGNKGLLTAGQQRDGLELLAGRLHTNFNAARQRLRAVLQLERSLAAAEHLRERLAEIGVDAAEFRDENIGHLAGDIADDALEVALGRQHVVALAAEVFIPLVHAGKFVDGAEVRRAEAGDLLTELRGALRSGSRA